MYYDFAVTVPAGTLSTSPVEQTLKLTKGIIHRVEVEFPAGCRGYVSLKLMRWGHQLFPTNPDGVFNTEDYIIPIDDHYPLVAEPFTLKAVAWSPETKYSHTITVRVGVLRSDVLSPFMVVGKMFAQFLEMLGIKPAAPEEELPEAVAPAPPAPICTIGDSKCEGYDLYLCQEVGGTAQWVLVEENSPQCGYVPPAPAPPAPAPAPAPPPAPPVAPSGKILEVSWKLWQTEVWHPMSDPIPYSEIGINYVLGFRVSNTGRTATFKAGLYEYDAFLKWHWSYSPTLDIGTGDEGLIEWPLWAYEVKGSKTFIFALFADITKVDETPVTITIK